MALTRRTFTRSYLLPLLAAVGLLGLFAGVCQSGRPTPASGKGVPPANFITGVEHEIGEMDPRLAEVLNAFGSSRHEECRSLAEALREDTTDRGIITECVGLIILSHLEQGHFAAAREAAERLRSVSPDVCQDLLPRVNREERDYNAEVSRLQHIVASTMDLEEAARAQLRTTRIHQIFGRVGLAEKSYRKVVEHYPTSPVAPQASTQLAALAMAHRHFQEAEMLYHALAERWPDLFSTGMARIAMIRCQDGRFEAAEQAWWEVINISPDSPEARSAIAQIVAIHRRLGRTEDALQTYWTAIWTAPETLNAADAVKMLESLAWQEGTPDYARHLGKAIADQAPDSELANAACQQLFELASSGHKAAYGETRATFEEIASAHPDTQAADTARYHLGKLYAVEGGYEAAEEVWAALVADRPKATMAPQARAELADVRYSLGMKAFTDRDYEKAADWLGALLVDIEMLGPRTMAARLQATSDGMLQPDQRYVVFSLGEACEKLGRWGEAADAFARLAVAGNPAEEIALARLVRCYVNMGDRARARHECDRLKERFPDGPHTRAAEDLL